MSKHTFPHFYSLEAPVLWRPHRRKLALSRKHFRNAFFTICCIITGLFISLKKHCENVSEKEPIFADEGATVRALLKNKNAEK
jgi:hypothetical protein